VRLATADYNLDGKDEYVEAVGGTTNDLRSYYRIYGDYKANGNDTSSIMAFEYLDHAGGMYPAVAAYDLDNDGLPDTIFAWKSNLYSNYGNSGYTFFANCMVVRTRADTAAHKPVFTQTESKTENYTVNTPYDDGAAITRLVVGKFEWWGDDYKALIMGNGFTFNFLNEGGGYLWGASKQGETFTKLTGNLAAADINGDGYADFVGIVDGKLLVSSSNPRTPTDAHSEVRFIDNSYNAGDTAGAAICLPNVDSEGGPYAQPSMVLEKKLVGHKLLFTRPQIIAVLASPPYWTGSTNLGGGTSYGKSIGQSVTESSAVGASAGVAIGGSFDASIFGKLTVQATVSGGFHKGWEESVTKTASVGDSIGTGEDLVVFNSTAYDVYYYRITEKKIDDSTDLKDEIISFAFPREMKIYSLEREMYNEWIQDSIDHPSSGDDKADTNYLIPTGSTAVGIGLGHTIGNPFSYPTKTQKNAFQLAVGTQGFFSDKGATERAIGGSDTGTLDLGLSGEISNTTTIDWNAAVGVKVVLEGGFFKKIASEAWAQAEYEGSSSTSVTKGTYIDGSIPHLDKTYWADHPEHHFSVGLMAFPVQDLGQQYMVVTYWVEPLGS
jgi:hypothetical protein